MTIRTLWNAGHPHEPEGFKDWGEAISDKADDSATETYVDSAVGSGIADHEAASDPHPQYLQEAQHGSSGDPHTQYLLADGSRAVTGDFEITGQLDLGVGLRLTDALTGVSGGIGFMDTRSSPAGVFWLATNVGIDAWNGDIRLRNGDGNDILRLYQDRTARFYGETSISSSAYRDHLRIERSGTGADTIELTPSTDAGGSLRILVDGTITARLSPSQTTFDADVFVDGDLETAGSIRLPNAGGSSPVLNIAGKHWISDNDDRLTIYTRGAQGSEGFKLRGSSGTSYSDLFVVNNAGQVQFYERFHWNTTNPWNISSGEGWQMNTSANLQIARSAGSVFHANRTGSSSGDVISTRYNGTRVGGIQVSSNSTTFDTSSDYRLKENVEDIDDALDLVKLLRPVSYTWISSPEEGTVHGFLAHEVQDVVPYAAHGEKDAHGIEEEGGEPGPIYQTMDHSKLVPLLTAAVKELASENKVLRDELSEVRSQVGI